MTTNESTVGAQISMPRLSRVSEIDGLNSSEKGERKRLPPLTTFSGSATLTIAISMELKAAFYSRHSKNSEKIDGLHLGAAWPLVRPQNKCEIAGVCDRSVTGGVVPEKGTIGSATRVVMFHALCTRAEPSSRCLSPSG